MDVDEAVAIAKLYLDEAQKLTSEWKVFPRNALMFPFDSISLAFVSKGFSLSRACLLLTNGEHFGEAYGLSRSLVECSLILRYLTIDLSSMSQKAKDFFWYSKAYKNYWLHWCRTVSDKKQMESTERLAKEWKLDGDPQPALDGWVDKRRFTTFRSQKSDHPLDGNWISPQFKASAYAVDYFQTSQFVHCSQPALDSFFPDDGARFEVAQAKGDYATARFVAYILISYMHLVLRYAMYGLGIEDSKKLDKLTSDSIAKIRMIAD